MHTRERTSVRAICNENDSASERERDMIRERSVCTSMHVRACVMPYVMHACMLESDCKVFPLDCSFWQISIPFASWALAAQPLTCGDCQFLLGTFEQTPNRPMRATHLGSLSTKRSTGESPRDPPSMAHRRPTTGQACGTQAHAHGRFTQLCTTAIV